jgi:hypothetical protein
VNLDFSATWWLPTYLLAALLAVLLLYRGYAVLRSRRPKASADREPVGWVLWVAFMPMLFMWLFSHLIQPVFLPRALIPSAMILYIALGWLFTRAEIPRLIVAILAGAWAIVIGYSLITLYTWDTFPNGRFDDAADYLADRWQEGDVIVHGNKITALPIKIYARDLSQRYVRDIPGAGSDTLARATQQTLQWLADDCIAAAAGGAGRVWYITFDKLEDEMIELVEDDQANGQYDSLRWLRTHYHEAGVKRFTDLNVYEFDNPDTEAMLAQCSTD